MFYNDIRDKASLDFKRLTGVEHETFVAMLKVAQRASGKFGRPPKLSDADQLLLALMYRREYRTQYHIATTYGISEPTCSRIIRRIEAILTGSRQFTVPKRLPSKPSQFAFEAVIVIVDVTEVAAQRPKKWRCLLRVLIGASVEDAEGGPPHLPTTSSTSRATMYSAGSSCSGRRASKCARPQVIFAPSRSRRSSANRLLLVSTTK